MLAVHHVHSARPSIVPHNIMQGRMHARSYSVQRTRMSQRSPLQPSISRDCIQKAFAHHAAKPNPIKLPSLPNLHHVKVEKTERFSEVQFSEPRPANAHSIEWSWWQTFQPDLELRLFSTPNHKTASRPGLKEVENFLHSIANKKCDEQISSLQNYIFNKQGGVTRFNTIQTNHLYKALNNLGAHDAMVEMIEHSPDETFKKSSENLLLYSRANLKSSYFNPVKALKIVKDILQGNSKLSDAYYTKGLVHAHKCLVAKDMSKMVECMSIAKDTLIRFRRSFNSSEKNLLVLSRKEYKQELDQSIKDLEKAFKLKRDPDYGVHLIYQLLERDEPSKAQEIAKQIWKARKDFAHKSTPHEKIRAVLVAGILSDAPRASLVYWTKLLKHTAGHDFQLKESIETLKMLSQHSPSPFIKDILNSLKSSQA